MSQLDDMFKEIHAMVIHSVARRLVMGELTEEEARNILKRKTIPDLKDIAAILDLRVGRKRKQEIIESIVKSTNGRATING